MRHGVIGEYLIFAPTYKILSQATLRTFFKWFPKGLGNYQKGESRIILNNGGIIWVRSVDNPDAIEGLTCRRAWGDEFGLVQQSVFDKLQERLTQPDGEPNGRCILTTTPYGSKNSWINQNLIEKRHELPWLEYINFSTKDNTYISHEVFDRAKQTRREEIFLRDFLGIYVSMEGMVYPEFDRKVNV